MNLEAAGEPLLVTFSPGGKRAQAFDREQDGRSLRFENAGDGRMVDLATRSTWDVVTGECQEGTLKGRQLTPRAGTLSYRETWRSFFPKGKIEP